MLRKRSRAKISRDHHGPAWKSGISLPLCFCLRRRRRQMAFLYMFSYLRVAGRMQDRKRRRVRWKRKKVRESADRGNKWLLHQLLDLRVRDGPNNRDKSWAIVSMTRGKRKKGKKVGSDRGEKMGLEKMMQRRWEGRYIEWLLTSDFWPLGIWISQKDIQRFALSSFPLTQLGNEYLFTTTLPWMRHYEYFMLDGRLDWRNGDSWKIPGLESKSSRLNYIYGALRAPISSSGIIITRENLSWRRLLPSLAGGGQIDLKINLDG